ncbi:MAG: hypothetical protein RLZ62_408, partial [Bacteroidota bacterium]
MNSSLTIVLVVLFYSGLSAQTALKPVYDSTAYQGGAWARLEIENGDSIFVMALRPVKISAPRKFRDQDEQRQYWRYA